jgi:hypothetical protein
VAGVEPRSGDAPPGKWGQAPAEYTILSGIYGLEIISHPYPLILN